MQPNPTLDAASELRRQGSMRRRMAMATVVLFVAGLLGLAIVPALSSEPGLPKITGSLPRFADDAAHALGYADGAALAAASDTATQSGVGFIDAKLDRLYQLYNLTSGPQSAGLALVERDLNGLNVTRTLVVAGHRAMMAHVVNGTEWVSAVDDKADRLYLAYERSGGPLGALASPAPTQDMPGLLGIDLHTLTYTDSTFPDVVASAADSTLIIVGLEYDESTDTLLALQDVHDNSSQLANGLVLVGWSAADLTKGGPLPQVTPRIVKACKRDPVSAGESPYLTPILIGSAPDPADSGKVKTWVTFPCYSTAYSSNVVIVRLLRSSALAPDASDERVVVAPAGVVNWAEDGAHGRLFLVNDSAEADAWVYELSSSAFVGILALSPRNTREAASMALGVDEATGRLYGRAPSYGLFVAAGAQDPVPQADVYPRLGAASAYRLLVDGRRNRVFSLVGSPKSGGAAKAYDIITVPPPPPPPPPDNPDSRTAQVDEAPGKTAHQFGGNASAYGLRVLLSRGVAGAVPTNGNSDAADLNQGVNSDCGFTDRELVLARVSKTELSNTSKFARAAALDADSATIVDSSTPSRCDIYNSYKSGPAGPIAPFLDTPGLLGTVDQHAPASSTLDSAAGPHTAWDYSPADCTTDDGQANAGPNTKALAGPASVDCTKDDEISAAAEGRAKPGDGLDVTVSRAVASTKVRLDDTRGVITTATSRLEGVRIGDISIGYIAGSATSFAHGRAGTAGTEFKTAIGYVDGPGLPSCTDACDVDSVITALNSALAGRAEFRKVAPQADLAAGTPGGYEAGVLKSQKQQSSDASLSGDKSNEVPVLEMIVYNDSASGGRARQVYQFGGVRADSHYGIEVLGASGCESCFASPGSLVDASTGAVTLAAALPNSGTPLSVHVAAQEGVLHRFARQSVAGADYSVRLIFSSPRDALLMATVWALLWAPFIASRRRRALRRVAEADPEELDG